MKQYCIYILLKKPIENWGNLIKEFIEDGIYFDKIEIQSVSDSTISIVYSLSKAPISVDYTLGIPFKIANVPFFVENSKKRPIQAKIAETLKEISACVTLKLENRHEFDEIVWQMLDNLEAYLVKLVDGIILTQEGNFYNHKLEKIYKL